MSHEHVHLTHDESGGLGAGMIVGVMLALLVVVVAAFFYFGGFLAGNGTATSNGDETGADGSGGTGEGAPTSSHQYLVPDYQLTVR